MRTPSRETPFGRVIVLLDVTSDHPQALESAAALASRLEVPLMALFLEHGDLRALENHPLVRSIDLPTGLGRRLERGAMRRDCRALARRTQRRLAQLARHHQLKVDFRRVHGDLREHLGHLGERSDLMVVESSGRTVTRHTRVESRGHLLARNLAAPVVFVGARPRRLHSVALVYDGSATAERGLATALDLARDGVSMLTLIWVGESDDAIESFRDDVQRRLAKQRRRLHVHTRRISCRDTDTIMYVASQMHANFLIVPASDTYPCGADIDRLTVELDCPVLVLRSQFGDESDDPERRRAAIER